MGEPGWAGAGSKMSMNEWPETMVFYSLTKHAGGSARQIELFQIPGTLRRSLVTDSSAKMNCEYVAGFMGIGGCLRQGYVKVPEGCVNWPPIPNGHNYLGGPKTRPTHTGLTYNLTKYRVLCTVAEQCKGGRSAFCAYHGMPHDNPRDALQ